jgi:ABC-type cobalamin/Fe3+-siderophores transport system ATPase subunit
MRLLLKSSNGKFDKLALFQKNFNNGWVEDLMMELSFLAENGKSCFSQSIYERCASFNLDEPTAALDARAEYEVSNVLQNLLKENLQF